LNRSQRSGSRAFLHFLLEPRVRFFSENFFNVQKVKVRSKCPRKFPPILPFVSNHRSPATNGYPNPLVIERFQGGPIFFSAPPTFRISFQPTPIGRGRPRSRPPPFLNPITVSSSLLPPPAVTFVSLLFFFLPVSLCHAGRKIAMEVSTYRSLRYFLYD